MKEPSVLFVHGDMGQWERYDRSENTNDVAYYVFSIWDRGGQHVFGGGGSGVIRTRSEVEDHLKGLIERAAQDTDEYLHAEIDHLRKLLREGDVHE